MNDADLSVCTWSGYDEGGFLGVQAGALAEASHGMTPFHHLGPGGLHHRPRDPDQQGELGALCLRWFDSHEGFCLVLGDVRTEAALPELSKGATLLHDTGNATSPCVSYVLLDPEAKQVTLKTQQVGTTIRIENREGVVFEIAGSTLRIEGAAAVEIGGGAQAVALASLVEAQLTILAAAIQSAATAEKGAGGAGGTSALAAALSGWPNTVGATVLKSQ